MATETTKPAFADAVAQAYAAEVPAIELGFGVHAGDARAEAAVRLPLGMANGHGLVAGATGKH